MKQWEYSTLLVGYNHLVIELNGLQVGDLTASPEEHIVSTTGLVLYDYLNDLGQEGWDVIAVVPTSGGEGCTYYMVILKRPAS